MKALFTVLVLVGCGAQEQADVKSEDSDMMLSVEKELPSCNSKREGQLGYIRGENAFYICEGEKWEPVEVKGKDGTNGRDGTDGISGRDGGIGPQGPQGAAGSNGKDGIDGTDGAKGQDGLQGPQGATGAQGSQGQAGQAGAQGSQGIKGEDGITPYTPKLYSLSGVEIGRVVTVSEASGRYWIQRDNIRLEVYRTGGTLSSANVFYSSSNCTGQMRIARGSAVWANTVISNYDGKIYKQIGSYSNSWAYQSKNTGTSCTNSSGTIDRAFQTQETTLTGYPWGDVEFYE